MVNNSLIFSESASAGFVCLVTILALRVTDSLPVLSRFPPLYKGRVRVGFRLNILEIFELNCR